jgi:hypothetical protein
MIGLSVIAIKFYGEEMLECSGRIHATRVHHVPIIIAFYVVITVETLKLENFIKVNC